MLNRTSLKVIAVALAAIAVFAAGGLVGRRTVAPTTQVQRIVVEKPVPYKVKVPADTLDIVAYAVREGLVPVRTKRDSIFVIDTVYVKDEIVKDGASERLYKESLADGAAVSMSVQYNRLSSFSVTLPEQRKRIEPYVIATAMTSGDVGIEAGVFLKNNIAIGARYQRDIALKKNAYGVSIGYKF